MALLPDFNKNEILNHLAGRYAGIDVGLGSWENVDVQKYFDKVYSDYDYIQRKIDAGFQLNETEQEFVRDLNIQQIIDYGSDISEQDGGYNKRMTFPDMEEFNKFLDTKPDYIDLINNGIYEYRINELGEIEFFNLVNSY